jgi:hypothetical protein
MLLRKLGLVMWKNLLLRKRHWILTSFEIVIPVGLFILAAVIRSLAPSEDNITPAQYFDVENEENLRLYFRFYNSPLLYAPDNSFTRCIMDNITSYDDISIGK